MPKKSNTRSAQGTGTIRQRKDGRWEARYTVGRDPGTGKQIQRSVYGSTQKEVAQKLKEITVDIDKGIYTEPSRLTVEGWLDIWLSEYVEPSCKPLTYSTYESRIREHIKPALGKVKLSSLNTAQIQKLCKHRCTRGTNKIK